MHTQHANFNNFKIFRETNMNRKPNLLNIIVMSIIAGFILVSGFFMSMLLLAVSAVLLPIVAIKLWLIKRQFEANKATTQENDDIIEAEYVIVDVTVETDEKG